MVECPSDRLGGLPGIDGVKEKRVGNLSDPSGVSCWLQITHAATQTLASHPLTHNNLHLNNNILKHHLHINYYPHSSIRSRTTLGRILAALGASIIIFIGIGFLEKAASNSVQAGVVSSRWQHIRQRIRRKGRVPMEGKLRRRFGDPHKDLPIGYDASRDLQRNLPNEPLCARWHL